jgi:hypothetical protein
LVSNFAINDLKGNIPKFVANAGASYHAGIFTNLKKTMDEMSKNKTLPTLDNKPLKNSTPYEEHKSTSSGK